MDLISQHFLSHMAWYLQIRPADCRGIIQLGYLCLDGKRTKKHKVVDFGKFVCWGDAEL